MVLGIENPFSRIFNAISSEKRSLVSMPFLLTYIDARKVKFDWSIQVAGAPAVCKGVFDPIPTNVLGHAPAICLLFSTPGQ